jgi:proton glutamate symport protein
MTDRAASGQGAGKRRVGLATQVFIGLGLGILVGVFFGEAAGILKVGGDAFIALLQITVIPYLVVALITSLGRLSLAEVKQLGVKGGAILLVLWAVGLLVVLASPLAFPSWPSASFFSASQIQAPKPVDFLQLYIPSNLFYSLSNAIVPAVVVFSVLFGLALIRVERKEAFLDFLSTVADALMGITAFVGRLAPYGVFAITAAAAGTINVADLGRLQVYIVVYVSMSLILSLWLVPGLITVLTPLRYGTIMRTFRSSLITAFATGSVLIVLPLLAAEGKRLLAATDEGTDSSIGREESSVDVLIPVAYPFPSLGVILSLLFVLFGGWYIGAAVSPRDYPTLTVAGVASLFGGTVLALPFLLDLLRLPADLFQVFVTVDVIGSRFGTLLAAMHLVAIALIGAYALPGALTLRWARVIRFGLVSLALTGTALVGIRGFYTVVYVEPYTKDQLLESLHLLEKPQPHTVYREPPPLEGSGLPRSLAQIKAQGVLRSCYVVDDYPTSYLNESGELVGFDVEMTHRFARDLDMKLEFLPVRSVLDAEERVGSGYCDVVMALLPLWPEMTERLAVTSPVLDIPLGLIVRDHRRQEFRTWAQVRTMRGLRIAIPDTPSAARVLASVLPSATGVVMREEKDIGRILASGASDVDAVGAFAQEGAAWTILYPRFSLVTPTPTQFVPAVYAVAHGNDDLLLYLDTWLLNAKLNGTVDEIYRYWMLGRVERTQPPRWSVIRNVLHWVE